MLCVDLHGTNKILILRFSDVTFMFKYYIEMTTKIRVFLVVFCASMVFVSVKALADTLTVMHYNLMYYDHNYDEAGCTSVTNNVDNKDACLRIIVNYVKPDIFTVNEVGAKLTSVERIKNNVLNINGVSKYARADMVQESYMTNMLYYNTQKLQLVGQSYANSDPRKTQFYRLKVKGGSTSSTDTTLFLTCGLTHLKAGSYPENVEARSQAAGVIMNYINTAQIIENVLFMGDLNVYRASEGAFQKLTTATGSSGFRFYDPINRVGEWTNNYSYRDIHTQSTRSAQDPCFSYGGMDDRFDFILVSADIKNATKGIKYHSYKALGQDGKRFNQSLISPTNTSVPSDVLNALYNMSDHLPVIMKLVYNKGQSSLNPITDNYNIVYNNPVTSTLNLRIVDAPNIFIVKYYIFNIMGVAVYSSSLGEYTQQIEHNIEDLPDGVYFVHLRLSNGYTKTVKMVVQ